MASSDTAGPARAVTEFTLAPKVVQLLRDGTFAASTAQGVVAVQVRKDATTKGESVALRTLIPTPAGKEAPTVVVGSSDTQRGAFAWVTIDGAGRLLARRSTAPGDDVLTSVAGADAIYAFDQYIVVVDSDCNSHLFQLPPSLLSATDNGETVPEVKSLGSVPVANGNTSDFIGVAVSSGSRDGAGALATFAQDGADLSVTAVAVNGGAPCQAVWTASVTLAGDALPVGWAIASDASVVCVLLAGEPPLFIGADGRVATPAIANALGPVTVGSAVAVSGVDGNGFVFAVRPRGSASTTVEVRNLSSPTAAHAPVLTTIRGLVMKKATAVLLSTRRSSRGFYHCRVLVGRALFDPRIDLPHEKAATRKTGAAATAEETQQTASAAAPTGTLALLAAMRGSSNDSSGAAATMTMDGAAADSAVVDYAIGKRKTLPATVKVLRDPGCSRGSAGAATTHSVVDAIFDATASNVTNARDALTRYFAHAHELEATTVVHTVLRLCAVPSEPAAAATPAPKRRGGKASGKAKAAEEAPASSGAAGSTAELPAQDTTALGHVLHAAAEKVRGSVVGAWRATHAATRGSAAPRAFTGCYAVLLHALSTGRLATVQLAMSLMDAMMREDVDTLLARCPGHVGKAQTLIASIATWASSEPGFRLGQLTAHSGAEFTLTKEPQPLPLRGHRIDTAAVFRVEHERQAL